MSVPNNKKTNIVRANVFEVILTTVRGEPNAAGQSTLCSLFQKNVQDVAMGLQETLEHIVNGRMDALWSRQMHDVARKLGMLALEMGTQRARVTLEVWCLRNSSS